MLHLLQHSNRCRAFPHSWWSSQTLQTLRSLIWHHLPEVVGRTRAWHAIHLGRLPQILSPLLLTNKKDDSNSRATRIKRPKEANYAATPYQCSHSHGCSPLQDICSASKTNQRRDRSNNKSEAANERIPNVITISGTYQSGAKAHSNSPVSRANSEILFHYYFNRLFIF